MCVLVCSKYFKYVEFLRKWYEIYVKKKLWFIEPIGTKIEFANLIKSYSMVRNRWWIHTVLLLYTNYVSPPPPANWVLKIYFVIYKTKSKLLHNLWWSRTTWVDVWTSSQGRQSLWCCGGFRTVSLTTISSKVNPTRFFCSGDPLPS